MEDSHATILDLDNSQNKDSSSAPSKEKMSFFSVYDGHGGIFFVVITSDNTSLISGFVQAQL